MRKEQKRKRRQDKGRPRNALPGSWNIEYQCGKVKNMPPANQNDVVEKAKRIRHKCNLPGCKPWRYVRILDGTGMVDSG